MPQVKHQSVFLEKERERERKTEGGRERAGREEGGKHKIY